MNDLWPNNFCSNSACGCVRKGFAARFGVADDQNSVEVCFADIKAEKHDFPFLPHF